MSLAIETSPARGASNAWAPLALCLGAGFAIAFAPVLTWRIQTGDWVCLNDSFTLFYLRFAALVYYHRVPYLSDIVVPGGVTDYSWLEFVPATYAARAIGASPFAVNLIWIFLSAIGLSTALYMVFGLFLKRRWPAAGCTIFCLADYGFAAAHPLATQLQILASALWRHPRDQVTIPWGLLLQWRVPDPGLNLALLFFQIVALGRARERPTRANLCLSAAAFGLLYYVFFYCWTMAAAGLCIASMLDRTGRKVYAVTLGLGMAIGLPQLLYSINQNHRACAEAIRRFGLFVPAPRLEQFSVPTLSLIMLAAAGVWIWKVERFDLLYAWSLATAGLLLSRSRIITGIFFHEYHYTWFWTPVRMIIVLIAVLSILSESVRWRPRAIPIAWMFLMLYLAGGVYISAICVTRTWSGEELLGYYKQYKAQRLAPGARPLSPGAMIAGADGYCELAAVAQNEWVLSGEAVPRSFAVGNDEWELRAALNAYLEGMDRAEFEKSALHDAALWFWENPATQADVTAAFMRKYDEVTRDPARYVDEFGVRYVAFPAAHAPMAYTRAGWTMLEPGPYWQIWERTKVKP